MGSRFSAAGAGRTGRNPSLRPSRPEKALSSRGRIARHLRAVVGAFLAALAVAAPFAAAPSARGQAGAETLWVRQFGTAGGDYGSAVAVDAAGIYVVGRTLGAMPADDYDALLRKYDLNGGLLWNGQFGTAIFDYGNAVGAGGPG